MTLYKVQKTKSKPSGYRISYDSLLLLAYCSFAGFEFYKVVLFNIDSKFGAQDTCGLLLAMLLILTSLIAAFRKEDVFLLIGFVVSLILILAALLGASKDEIGIVFFEALIWLDPSLAFRSLIGNEFENADLLVALKLSYLVNLLPGLIIFVGAYLYRKIIDNVAA